MYFLKRILIRIPNAFSIVYLNIRTYSEHQIKVYYAKPTQNTAKVSVVRAALKTILTKKKIIRYLIVIGELDLMRINHQSYYIMFRVRSASIVDK